MTVAAASMSVTRTLRGRPLFLATLGLLAVSAQAHHSMAIFDRTKTVEIRGTIVDFKLRNPHSSFVVDGVRFANGAAQGNAVERWEIEADATAFMRTAGMEADTFRAGDRVTIIAYPHRDPGFRFARAAELRTADGRQFDFGLRASARIFSPSLKRAAGARAPNRRARDPAAPDLSAVFGIDRLAGRWQQPLTLRAGGGERSPLPLNDAGRAARRDYDPKRSPANTCEPISIPELFNAPFFLFEIRFAQGRHEVLLRHELYDVVRAVPLSGEPAKADRDGLFGTVEGRIEGESLVVESRDYPPSAWGLGIATQILGGGADVPSSARKTVRERYSVSADGRTLVVEYTVYDPVYLTAPYSNRVELTRVPDDERIYPYQCDPESASMWSRAPSDAPLRIGRRPTAQPTP